MYNFGKAIPAKMLWYRARMEYKPDPDPFGNDPNNDPLERLKKEYERRWRLTEESDPAKKAKAKFDDNVELVTDELIRLALHARSEMIRFKSAEFILMNRVFIEGGSNEELLQDIGKFFEQPTPGETQ